MPEISRFYGIVIKMFYADHPPPHFHAEYSGHNAVIDIATLTLISGQLPTRALELVQEWAAQHRAELIRNWERIEALNPPDQVPPMP